jgi:hypothetical protein
MSKNSLAIGTTTIKQDAEGRFRLNDLHKASGGEKRHQVSNWLATQQAKELIDELENRVPVIQGTEQNQPLIILQGGSKQGTYAVKQLVYAYAMWLSPKFHLHVIDAYDELVSKERAELEWRAIRGGSKVGFTDMSKAVKTIHDERGEIAPFYAYTNEADLLNVIILGVKSKQFRIANGLSDKALIRDYMTKEQLEAYESLEYHNTCFINADMDFVERAIKLKALFDRRFKDKVLSADVKQLA